MTARLGKTKSMPASDSPTRSAAVGPHVVRLTPPGRGAIASVLVEGPGAVEVVTAECHAAPGSLTPGDSRLRLVRFGPEPAEDVVLHLAAADRVELHCHGGQAVIDRLVELLAARGCVVLDWRAWVDQRSDDPVAAAALKALAAAPTLRTAAILIDQYHGALGAAIQTAAADLAAGRTHAARDRLAAIARRASLGRHLQQPWRVVLAGPPNAGKSTLLNALLGYARAIVHPTPGTTRDLVTATTAIDGWPVELVDTAGLRDSDHPLEQTGMALAERELGAADLVVLVFDASRSPGPADAALAARYPAALIVENKADLPRAERSSRGLLVSALTGQGIDALIAAISARLVPEPPPPGAAVPFTEDQIARIEAMVREAEMGFEI